MKCTPFIRQYGILLHRPHDRLRLRPGPPTSAPPPPRCRTPRSLNTGLSEDSLRQIVADNTEGKMLGVFGEDRVHVLRVNVEIARALGLIGQ